MTKRSLLEYLDDILETITDIETFTDAVDFDAFQGNREKILAVVKSIEILKEAVKKIPDEIRAEYPQVPWRSITGMMIFWYMNIGGLMLLLSGLRLKKAFHL